VRNVGLIAGVMVAAIVVVLVLAVLAGTGAQHHAHTIFDQPAIISQAQYDATGLGADETTLERRFNSVGIPEHALSLRVQHAFTAHHHDVRCDFWRIDGRPGVYARLCFTSPGAQVASRSERTVAAHAAG
jgi:hypothetical protein